MDDPLDSSRSLSDTLRRDDVQKLNGEKRSSSSSSSSSSTESEGRTDVAGPACKRSKKNIGDLHSVGDSSGTETLSSVSKVAEEHVNLRKNEETSEITTVPALTISDELPAVPTGQNTLAACLGLSHADSVTHPIDLNVEAQVANNKLLLVTKHHKDHDLITVTTSKGTGLDLNAVDDFNSVNQDPLLYPYNYKTRDHVKARDASACGSSTGLLEEKDPWKVWKKMKENGFLSSAHGGIPVPMQRERKKKNDLKKKIELAKREQVNRFTKAAAPSGLLNGLNPGIINHVRNSKQVHSIIESLVRSEKLENGIQSSQPKRGTEEFNDRRKYPEGTFGSGAIQSSHLIAAAEPPNTSSESTYFTKYPMSSNISSSSTRLSSDHLHGHGYSSIMERRISGENSGVSPLTSHWIEEKRKFKLSSSVGMGSENISTVSNEESTNQSSVSSLSVKAANVASQWLELLSQDIKGRLAALRRSKKRVQGVIQTELPFLLSKEFSSNEANSPSTDMHRARWTAIFDQMEKKLTEEGKQLECWLNQVKDMQMQCDVGLQCVDWYRMQVTVGRFDSSENGLRLKKEKETAVKAAAASIYSTCNLVTAKEEFFCD